jgi:hypothetical protein
MRKCAWDLAAELAAQTETKREADRQKIRRDGDPPPLTDDVKAAIERLNKKWGA